ncbi:MAG: PadR family transcriptional regulator, partial [Acidimicrobiia bacterium]
MDTTTLSLTEHAVLGLLAEGPSHGFALARELQADHDVGRIITVRRPLVYRALDRLVASGAAAPVQTEKGDAGPNRTIHRVTSEGRRMTARWYGEPVEHVREIR